MLVIIGQFQSICNERLSCLVCLSKGYSLLLSKVLLRAALPWTIKLHGLNCYARMQEVWFI